MDSYQCIFCGKGHTILSNEHVIQAALGCNLSSKLLSCPSCNNYFSAADSGNIDNVFVDQFSLFRNLLNIYSDRNHPPPILRNIAEIDGCPVHLAPGGVPILAKSIRSSSVDENGNLKITVAAPSIDKGKEQKAHILKQLGEDSMPFVSASTVRRFLEDLKFSISIGGEISSKAVLKNLYLFLFYIQRNRRKSLGFKVEDFLALRKYLRDNVQTDEAIANIDYLNPLPMTMEKDDISNFIFLFSVPSENILFGQVVVLGHFQFSGYIKANCRGRLFSYGFKQDPLTREREFFEGFTSRQVDLSVTKDYAENAPRYFKTMEQKTAELMEIYYKMASKNIAESLVERALTKFPEEEGKIMNHKVLNDFLEYQAVEMTNYILRIPSELPADEDLV